MPTMWNEATGAMETLHERYQRETEADRRDVESCPLVAPNAIVSREREAGTTECGD